jgi:hypothetical protein
MLPYSEETHATIFILDLFAVDGVVGEDEHVA